MRLSRSLLAVAAAILIACGGSEGAVHGVVADGSVPDGSPLPSNDDAGDANAPDAAPLPAPWLGANVEAGGVVFRVWAPHATSAWVTGDFPGGKSAMQPLAGGVFEAHVAGAYAGSTYRYSFDSPGGSLDRNDPYCRELGGGGCKVVDPNLFAWHAAPFKGPAKNASVVYEMHVGSFTAAGTLAQARAGLGQLADLGVNVVELMPVHDFGGNGVWGYSPQLWLAPEPTYGTADDLRAFVDQAHGLGIAVWLDVVMNHYNDWSEAPLFCFDGDCPDGSAGIYFFPPGPYASTPWGPRPDFSRKEVQTMLLASVQEWLVEYRGDGFRWDSVSNIRAIDGAGTMPGGRDLLVAATDRTRALGGMSVAEDLKGWDGISRPASSGGLGFDAQWDGFGYDIPRLLALASDDARDLGVVASALQGNYAGDPFARVLFTEDHDTVGNGGARLPNLIDPGDPTSFAARRRSMLGAVLLLTTPGVPMLFMGQESLATGTFADPPAPLDPPTPRGQKIFAFYKDMIRLRREVGGLADAEVEIFHRNDVAKVIAYRRHGASGQDAIVVVNLRNKAYTEYDIGVPSAGPWKVRLNTDRTAYGDDFVDGSSGAITAVAGAKDGKPFSLPLELGAYGAIVLTL